MTYPALIDWMFRISSQVYDFAVFHRGDQAAGIGAVPCASSNYFPLHLATSFEKQGLPAGIQSILKIPGSRGMPQNVKILEKCLFTGNFPYHYFKRPAIIKISPAFISFLLFYI
jgi:hypothetical protein